MAFCHAFRLSKCIKFAQPEQQAIHESRDMATLACNHIDNGFDSIPIVAKPLVLLHS